MSASLQDLQTTGLLGLFGGRVGGVITECLGNLGGSLALTSCSCCPWSCAGGFSSESCDGLFLLALKSTTSGLAVELGAEFAVGLGGIGEDSLGNGNDRLGGMESQKILTKE